MANPLVLITPPEQFPPKVLVHATIPAHRG